MSKKRKLGSIFFFLVCLVPVSSRRAVGCEASDFASSIVQESCCASETWSLYISYSDYPANACYIGQVVAARGCLGIYTNCAGDYVPASTGYPTKNLIQQTVGTTVTGHWRFGHVVVTNNQCSPPQEGRLNQTWNYSYTENGSFSHTCVF